MRAGECGCWIWNPPQARRRGCLPPDHPHFFSHTRKDALAEADVVLIVGTPLDFRLGYGAGIGETAKIVQVDTDAADGEPDAAVLRRLFELEVPEIFSGAPYWTAGRKSSWPATRPPSARFSIMPSARNARASSALTRE